MELLSQADRSADHVEGYVVCARTLNGFSVQLKIFKERTLVSSV